MYELNRINEAVARAETGIDMLAVRRAFLGPLQNPRSAPMSKRIMIADLGSIVARFHGVDGLTSKTP